MEDDLFSASSSAPSANSALNPGAGESGRTIIVESPVCTTAERYFLRRLNTASPPSANRASVAGSGTTPGTELPTLSFQFR